MTQQQQAQIVTPLNKISVKTVFGKIPVKAYKDEEGNDKLRLEAPMLIMRVLGQVTGYAVKQSNFGESLQFTGIFRATNAATGEIFESASCFLPNIVEGSLGKTVDENEIVEFAFEIGAIPATNAHGYEYRVKPLIATMPSPVFAQIEARVNGHLSLPSPAAHPATAPAPEPVAEKKPQQNKGGKK